MPALVLTPANRAAVHARLADGAWLVACLCAAWCDVCTDFRAAFDRLAVDRPDILFLWIDIEDEAEVVGEFDVENFPTILIERDAVVRFFGAVEPDAKAIARIVDMQTSLSPPAALVRPAASPDGTLQAALAAALGR